MCRLKASTLWAAIYKWSGFYFYVFLGVNILWVVTESRPLLRVNSPKTTKVLAPVPQGIDKLLQSASQCLNSCT